ncbi:MAG TPA: cytochrome d ubiquinol oxidase subunit II [Candidatus Obscuribacterales bacterium]
MDLNTVWFLLLDVIFTCYAVLDGFDLGVGALHLFTRTDGERRVMLNAIGPVWDGNEVWLVTGIGALFGAFPEAYSTLFSGFYLMYMLLLVGLIFRGVAIEFRSKENSNRWRNTWDCLFFLGSIVPPVIFGIMVGNLVIGLPVGADREAMHVTLASLLTPYPLLVGAFVLSLFTLHGAMYLNMKTEGELQQRIKSWSKRCFWIFLGLYIVTTFATIILHPHMIANFGRFWWAWILVIMTGLAVANVPRTLHLGYELRALLNSACIIAGTFTLFGIGVFPNIVRSSINPAFNLDVYSAAASQSTLSIMLMMAIIGIPFVLAYTIGIYWVFRGKVKVDKNGY